MGEKDYIKLGDLSVYQIALEASDHAWIIYERLDWQDKKIIGYQFIRSIDSVGANIAEGYGRFHYLDRIKFYYNARGSLLEAKHWTFLLYKRQKISHEEYEFLINKLNSLHEQLNGYIKSSYLVRNHTGR